jgi:hypothetical protein
MCAEASDWKAREASKLLSGEYKRVPWCKEAWWIRAVIEQGGVAGFHYAHVSNDDPTKIAYTPDERHGKEDRQLRTKPGRYLNKYFKDVLTPEQIRDWATKWAGENENLDLKLATEPDDIERVFVNGPSSCMGGDKGFSSSVHPTRVYGYGDLAVAYIERDEEITARVVCWPEKKVRGKIYGDAERLRPLLTKEGYTEGRFEGARLLRIADGNSVFVAPYIDGGYYVIDEDNHLLIADSEARRGCPHFRCDNTNGLIGGSQCERCEDFENEDDMVRMDGINQEWCQECYGDYGFSCEYCNELNDTDDSSEVDGDSWCSYCAREHASQCERCEQLTSDNSVYNVNDDVWCEGCYESYAFSCDRCGDNGDQEDKVEVEGKSWCGSCFESHGFTCENCDEPASDSVTVGGDQWCDSCVTTDSFECSECDERLPTSSQSSDDEEYCETCHKEIREREEEDAA